jgi:tetratricopeptide (TPR) repeat protein
MKAMNNAIVDIREQAIALRQERRYADALPLFRRLWEEGGQEPNAWDGWGYALCLKQTGDYAQALEVCRALHRLQPDLPPLPGLYAWCVYYQEIRPRPVADGERFLRAARAAVELCRGQMEHTPLALTVTRVMEYLLNLPQPAAEACLAWSQQVNAELLPDEPFLIHDEQGRPLALASPRERYHSLRLKALFRLGRWAECAAQAEAALAAVPEPRHDNHLWFRRYRAQALRRLERRAEAIEVYDYLLARRREWFFLLEAAQMHWEEGQAAPALCLAAQAALAPGEPAKKVKLYAILGEWLLAGGLEPNAREHLALACALRRAQGWKLPTALVELARAAGLDPDQAEASAPRPRALREQWTLIAFTAGPARSGTVSAMLPHGRAGFVEADDERRSYYFAANAFVGAPEELQPGLRVDFLLGPAHDPRKDKTSLAAVLLRPGASHDDAPGPGRRPKTPKNRTD